MTSDGHLYAQFQRAVKNGNLVAAEAAARELPVLSVRDTLSLVVLYARKDRLRFERAAIRWHVRYQQEMPAVGLRESALALSALHALLGSKPDVPLRTLSDLLESGS